MKKGLIWVGVALAVVGAAFGGGWFYAHQEVSMLSSQLQGLKGELAQLRTEHARVRAPLELCRAATEAARSNFGNAAERIEAAQRAAREAPDLRPFDVRLQEALEGARKLDPQTRERIEALLNEMKDPSDKTK